MLQVLNNLVADGVTLDLALSVESEAEFNAIVCSVIQLYKLNAPSESKCPPSVHVPAGMAGVPLSGIQLFHVPRLHGGPHPDVLNGVPRAVRGIHPAQKTRRYSSDAADVM